MQLFTKTITKGNNVKNDHLHHQYSVSLEYESLQEFQHIIIDKSSTFGTTPPAADANPTCFIFGSLTPVYVRGIHCAS